MNTDIMNSLEVEQDDHDEQKGIKIKKSADQAFDDAIASGRLSLNEDDDNYVGHYMWMGKTASRPGYTGYDTFKHRIYRNYLAPLKEKDKCGVL